MRAIFSLPRSRSGSGLLSLSSEKSPNPLLPCKVSVAHVCLSLQDGSFQKAGATTSSCSHSTECRARYRHGLWGFGELKGENSLSCLPCTLHLLPTGTGQASCVPHTASGPPSERDCRSSVSPGTHGNDNVRPGETSRHFGQYLGRRPWCLGFVFWKLCSGVETEGLRLR